MAVMQANILEDKAVANAAALFVRDYVRSRQYNIFTQVVGGRAFVRSEPYGKDDAYEYIRRVHDNLNHSVIDCCNSFVEK